MMKQIVKLGSFSVKHMTGMGKDGKEYNFYTLTKGYKDQNGEWKNIDMTLTPTDMAIVSALTHEAARLCAVASAEETNDKLQNKPVSVGGFTADDDGVPF